MFFLKAIFDKEHAANNMMTWVLRVVGWFIMFVGFGFMTSIVTTLGKLEITEVILCLDGNILLYIVTISGWDKSV